MEIWLKRLGHAKKRVHYSNWSSKAASTIRTLISIERSVTRDVPAPSRWPEFARTSNAGLVPVGEKLYIHLVEMCVQDGFCKQHIDKQPKTMSYIIMFGLQGFPAIMLQKRRFAQLKRDYNLWIPFLLSFIFFFSSLHAIWFKPYPKSLFPKNRVILDIISEMMKEKMSVTFAEGDTSLFVATWPSSWKLLLFEWRRKRAGVEDQPIYPSDKKSPLSSTDVVFLDYSCQSPATPQ